MSNKNARKQFDKLMKILKAKQTALSEFEMKHEAVFAKRRMLQEDVEGVVEQMKAHARALVDPGNTETLYSDDQLQVIVQAPKEPTIFDYEAACELWTEEQLNSVRVDAIDPKKIDVAVMNGILKWKNFDGVRKKGEAPTPRVTVKVL